MNRISRKKSLRIFGEAAATPNSEMAVCPATPENRMVGSQPSANGHSRRRSIANGTGSTGAAKGGTVSSSSGSAQGPS
jgi:hypothetical protein